MGQKLLVSQTSSPLLIIWARMHWAEGAVILFLYLSTNRDRASFSFHLSSVEGQGPLQGHLCLSPPLHHITLCCYNSYNCPFPGFVISALLKGDCGLRSNNTLHFQLCMRFAPSFRTLYCIINVHNGKSIVLMIKLLDNLKHNSEKLHFLQIYSRIKPQMCSGSSVLPWCLGTQLKLGLLWTRSSFLRPAPDPK